MKKIILFFGPPGSGKGTQADMLGERLGLAVVSPGELLRHERDVQTAIGKKVSRLLSQGQLVDDRLVEQVLDKRLSKNDAKAGYILDGYPRRREQLEHFKKRLAKLAKNDKVVAVYIEVADRTIKGRISGRRVCDCGAAYHVTNKPPRQAGVCDLCSAKLYQRQDDKPAILAGRLKRFHQRIDPILAFFRENYVFIPVDGELDIKSIKNILNRKLKRYL